jgi:hypothetical protein
MSEVILPGLSEENLLSRAIRNARDARQKKGYRHPRWVAVAHTFSLGSTYSKELCRLFGYDPNEEVAR